jgi:nucleotide-binding universal stress UspA family protein
MYSRILVPISFEDDARIQAALGVARALAAQGAEIVLMHVVEPVPPYAIRYVPDDLVKATRDGLAAELDRLAGELPGGRGELVTGHAGKAILNHATRIDADCIVIGSHRPEVQDYFFGSTAAHVVLHARCAVMVVR